MRFYAVAIASSVVSLSCGAPGAGLAQGEGRCDFAPDQLQGIAVGVTGGAELVCQQPDKCLIDGEPGRICGGTLEGRKTDRVVDVSQPCFCSRGEEAVGNMIVDGLAQKQWLVSHQGSGLNDSQLYPGCKDFRCTDPISCYFWQTSPTRCFQLAYVNGFWRGVPTQYPGGNFDNLVGHDGDEAGGLCVNSMGVQGNDTLVPLDIRSKDDFAEEAKVGTQQFEIPWCRWYGGSLVVPADVEGHQEVTFCDFRADTPGQRLSIVGDWVFDGHGLDSQGRPDPAGHSEIHDTRILTVVKSDRVLTGGGCARRVFTVFDESKRGQPGAAGFVEVGPRGTLTTCDDPNTPGCPNKDVWHMLTNGLFARDTAQQDALFIRVPLPPATFSGPKKLECAVPDGQLGGCLQGATADCACDKDQGTCDIWLTRTAPKEAGLSERACGSDGTCKCTNRTDDPRVTPCPNAGITEFKDVDRTDPQTGQIEPFFRLCNPSKSTHIAFARDIRAEWKDPDDLWQCECDCADPSSAGASIPALVNGCAHAGLNDDEDEEAREACEGVCEGALICGAAPACRIGSCHAVVGRQPSAVKIAVDACAPDTPPNRVAPHGDYLVSLDHSASTAEIGDMDDNNNLSVQATPHVAGDVWLNRESAPTELEFADMRVVLDDFDLPAGLFGLGTAEFTFTFGQSLNRFTAQLNEDKTFTVVPGSMKVSVQTRVNNVGAAAEPLNAGALTGTFDLVDDRFRFNGQGRNGNGKGIRLHLEGTVVNRPPVASAGPDDVVECLAPTTTPVALDGTSSTDIDPGDAITHYQWFEGAVGLSNHASISVQATLGDHEYALHVYDRKLGSSKVLKRVSVVDTTPPNLTVAEPVCLWPPNHAWARFSLSDIAIAVSDVCDTSPRVRIVSVVANEPADATGSGNTATDVAFGPTTACVRSERSGSGAGRTYTMVVEAKDASGNASVREFTVLVPHDMSGHPGCLRADGVDAPDASCLR